MSFEQTQKRSSKDLSMRGAAIGAACGLALALLVHFIMKALFPDDVWITTFSLVLGALFVILPSSHLFFNGVEIWKNLDEGPERGQRKQALERLKQQSRIEERYRVAEIKRMEARGKARVHGTADLANEEKAARAARGISKTVSTEGLNLDY
jgi:hypothetical protein